MLTTTIYIAASDQLLTTSMMPPVASGDHNSVKLHVDTDSYWEEYARSAVFFTSKDVTPYEVLLDSEGECAVPAEVLVEACTLYIGIRGVHTTDNAVKTSTIIKCKIREGTPTNIVAEPTLDLYQQLLQVAYEAKSTVSGAEGIAEDAKTIAEDAKTIANEAKSTVNELREEVESGAVDGNSPYIGENGNWWVGNNDTGVSATSGLQIQVVSYTGIGGHGSDTPTSVVLDRKPALFIVTHYKSSAGTPMIVGGFRGFIVGAKLTSDYRGFNGYSDLRTAADDQWNVKWDEETRTLSWYDTESASNQFNYSGFTYYCTAIF